MLSPNKKESTSLEHSFKEMFDPFCTCREPSQWLFCSVFCWKTLPCEELKISSIQVTTVSFPQCFWKRFHLSGDLCKMMVDLHQLLSILRLKNRNKIKSQCSFVFVAKNNRYSGIMQSARFLIIFDLLLKFFAKLRLKFMN